MTKTKVTSVVPIEPVSSIRVVRGQRVIIDRDLAAIYGVETRVLNQAVKRNADRFPRDFMFQLTRDEAMASRSQSVILKPGAVGTSSSCPSRSPSTVPFRPPTFSTRHAQS